MDVYDLIRRHEGLRLKPYRDTRGELTIGFGRNLDAKGISQVEAEFMFRRDVADCVEDLATFRWFAGLNSARQAAMIDMRFQLGAAGFREFTDMLAALAEGDWEGAATAMIGSKWYLQTPSRVNELANMIQDGEWPNA